VVEYLFRQGDRVRIVPNHKSTDFVRLFAGRTGLVRSDYMRTHHDRDIAVQLDGDQPIRTPPFLVSELDRLDA